MASEPYGFLDIAMLPDGTRGYHDLRRGASRERITDILEVNVASLADVIRSKKLPPGRRTGRSCPFFDRSWNDPTGSDPRDLGSDTEGGKGCPQLTQQCCKGSPRHRRRRSRSREPRPSRPPLGSR
jgi:hypothetical protein